MRILLAVVMALAVLVLGAAERGQEVRYARSGYAACETLDHWQAQQLYRDRQPRGWYPLMRRYVAAGVCWVTGKETPVAVRVTPYRHLVRVRRLDVRDPRWWWTATEAIQ